MNNPILSMLNKAQVSSNIAPFKQMFNTVKMAQNPQLALQQMAVNNPQVKQVLDYVNKNGGDPKTAFYALAKEKGVNPEEILKQLR